MLHKASGVHALQNPKPMDSSADSTSQNHHRTDLILHDILRMAAQGDQSRVFRNEIWLNVEVGKEFEQKLMNEMILLEATVLPIYV